MEPLKFDLRMPDAHQRALTNSTSGLAYQVDDRASEIVNTCRRAIAFRPDDGGAPESHRVPTRGERDELEHRRRTLAVMARGYDGDPVELAKAAEGVKEMLGGFLRTRNLDEPTKKRMIAGYLHDLRFLPAWAVLRACSRFHRGEVEGQNVSFAPTSAELIQQAQVAMSVLRAEERLINETLRLRPIRSSAAAEGELLAAKGRAWLDRTDPVAQQLHVDTGLSEGAKALMRRTAERDAAILQDEWHAAGKTAPMIAGVPISRELAARLNIQAPRIDGGGNEGGDDDR